MQATPRRIATHHCGDRVEGRVELRLRIGVDPVERPQLRWRLARINGFECERYDSLSGAVRPVQFIAAHLGCERGSGHEEKQRFGTIYGTADIVHPVRRRLDLVKIDPYLHAPG